jgi:transposase
VKGCSRCSAISGSPRPPQQRHRQRQHFVDHGSVSAYLAAQYRRLVRRLGSKPKAIVALEHSILTSVWHMLTDNTDYHDLGNDYFLKRDPERERRRAITALNKLGYTVTLNPIEPTQAAA